MSLLKNPAIDAAMKEQRPPASIPEVMLDYFSYGGKVQMKFWETIFNQRYMGGKVSMDVDYFSFFHGYNFFNIIQCSSLFLKKYISTGKEIGLVQRVN